MLFSELNPNQYHLIPLDENILRFPLINAVISGVQQGKVFTNQFGEVFVIHKSGFSLFVANKDPGNVNGFVSFIESSNDIPQYFHIYDPPQLIVDLISRRKDLFNVRLRKRIQLRANQSLSLENCQEKILDKNFTIGLVDQSNYDSLDELDIDIENKFWSSRKDFLKNGIGVCIQNAEKKTVSLCYSACVVDNVAEIDIITHPDYRKSGFGQFVTQEFVKLAQERKITPNWDCFEDNDASIATALKNHFVITYKYQFISVLNKKSEL